MSLAHSQYANVENSTFYDVAGNLIQNNCHQATEEDRCQAIASWLSDLNFKETQNDILAKRTYGTGQWLLECQAFRDWVVRKSEILWCPGIPGAGKTILASIVVDHLQNTIGASGDVAVACIYCNYKEQTKQSVSELVASLLRQFVTGRSVASAEIKMFYKNFHDYQKTRPKLVDLQKALKSEIETYSRVYIIVDALDECPECDQGELIKELKELRDVNLMVTSRPLLSIEQKLRGAERLDILANSDDVRKYIEYRIPNENKLARHVERHPSLRNDIVDRIVANVRGMFLMAKLHIDSLVSKTSLRAVRIALDNLPAGVDATYDEAMERIRRQVEDDRKLAERVLSWITYACRPLSQQELQYALAVTPEMTDMDSEALVDEFILIDVCAGLVVIDESKSMVRLVHYTTQQYFETKRDSLFPGAQIDIALTCLRYLSFHQFSYNCYKQAMWSLQESSPLFQYAASYWGYHAYGKAEESCKKMALQFLQKKANSASAIQVFLQSINNFARVGTFSGVHLLAFFGLGSTLYDLLQNGTEVDSRDSQGRTPMSWAAANGHEGVVRLLVGRNDVEVNSQDNYAHTLVSWAATNGHESVVKLLVARDGTKVNSTDEYTFNLLLWAAQHGHEEVVGLLMARDDIEVNSKDDYDSTPLWWAAKNGHEGVVRLLLTRDDIDINSEDPYHRTPLSLAAARGHEGVVLMLVARHDVVVNSKDPYHRTPLSLAAENGHEGVVRILIARDDIDVNSMDPYNRTPLSLAARHGHEGVVRLLVARDGVDVNSGDEYGRMPLSLAARYGHKGVVRLLLEQDDVDVDSKDKFGRIPLSWVTENVHEDVVRLIVVGDDVGSDLEAPEIDSSRLNPDDTY